jgi:hypothetical protein
MDCQSISRTPRSTCSSHDDDELFSPCCMTPLSDPFDEEIIRSFASRLSNSPPPPPQRRCGALEPSSRFNITAVSSKTILPFSDDIMLPNLSCCSSRRMRKKRSLTLKESSAFSGPQQQNPDDDDIQMTYPSLPLIKLKPKLRRYDLYERS